MKFSYIAAFALMAIAAMTVYLLSARNYLIPKPPAQSQEPLPEESTPDEDDDSDNDYDKTTCRPGPHTVDQDTDDASVPDVFYYSFGTTVDNNTLITIEVNSTWAPLGAKRFYQLTRDNYFDCAALFRVVPGFVVQWGIASEPGETKKWDDTFPDDPVLESNTIGTVSFATAGPGTRTGQIFVNLADNSRLDGQGFSPFGRVVAGMEVLTSDDLHVIDPTPSQAQYESKGNPWMLKNYPDVDLIKKGELVVEGPGRQL